MAEKRSSRAKLVQIGNSRGVRLPKALIEQAGLQDDIELAVREGEIVIRPVRTARAGWAEAAALMRRRGEAGALDEAISNRFDDEEWEWDGEV